MNNPIKLCRRHQIVWTIVHKERGREGSEISNKGVYKMYELPCSSKFLSYTSATIILHSAKMYHLPVEQSTNFN